MTSANPAVLGGVAPYLSVSDAGKAAFPEHGHPLEAPAAFTGDHCGQLRDPFGVTWSIAAPIARS